MKNKVYVERYAERLIAGDNLALGELCQCFINEFNADATRLHVTTDEAFNRLLSAYDRKGNELATMIHNRTGINVLKRGWFSLAVKLINDVANGGEEDGN